jgi:hypothetical protein
MEKVLEGQAYRDLLLSFIGDLTLADHMGDVSNDITQVLKRLGIDIEWDELNDLRKQLGKMGVKTLYGTTLYDPDDDEEEV